MLQNPPEDKPPTDPGTKLPDVGTTIFSVMSALAAEHGAINLSQGYPDFDCPARLQSLVQQCMAEGLNQYAPMAGVPRLQEALARKMLELYGREVDPATEVTVTAGATEALFCAFSALVRSGDEVIVFDPVYDAYQPAIHLAGGRTVRIPLTSGDYAVDWTKVADALNEHTRAIVINNPHNPTGATLSRSDLETLAELLRDRNVYVIADEVYEHIVFDGQEHQSIHRHEELAARSLVISSFGKTFHATGWKVGYCIAPRRLTEELRKVHQFVTFSVATPLQHAYARFLEEDTEHYRALPRFYQQKRDLFCSLLAGSRFRFRPSAGTYFQLADYSEISDRPDTEFARWLTTEVGVAVIPVSVFQEAPDPVQRLVRFCFAKNDDTLGAAAERLCRI
ncbi:MAG: pyridoxal phosphate-dependent aminotransferase [Gammaproteobacteria bacterium]